MQKGDNVLINYNTESNLQKVATFINQMSDNNGVVYYFKDIHGLFALTESFINDRNITLTVLEYF